jgi:hypothetical protein
MDGSVSTQTIYFHKQTQTIGKKYGDYMHKKYLILLTLTLSLLTSACHKKDDSKKDTNIALIALSVADLLSGQCLQIQKNGDKDYTVTGYNVPKGGCNTATLGKVTTTNIDAALEASENSYNAVIDILTDAGTDCTSIKASVVSSRNAVTASTIQAAASTECTGLGFTVGTSSYGSRVYCKNEDQAKIYRSNIKYVYTTDVLADMATSITAEQTSLTSGISANGWTADQIDAISTMNSTQLPIFSTYGPTFINAYGTELLNETTASIAGSTMVTACAAAILDTAPSTFKTLAIRTAFYPLTTVITALVTGGQNAAAASSLALGGKRISSASDVTDMTDYNPLMPYHQCVYGDNSTESTTVKTCDKTLTEF